MTLTKFIKVVDISNGWDPCKSVSIFIMGWNHKLKDSLVFLRVFFKLSSGGQAGSKHNKCLGIFAVTHRKIL